MCATQKGCVGFWCDRVKSFVALRASVCSCANKLWCGRKGWTRYWIICQHKQPSSLDLSQQKLCSSRISKRDHPTRTHKSIHREILCLRHSDGALALCLTCRCKYMLQQNATKLMLLIVRRAD